MPVTKPDPLPPAISDRAYGPVENQWTILALWALDMNLSGLQKHICADPDDFKGAHKIIAARQNLEYIAELCEGKRYR